MKDKLVELLSDWLYNLPDAKAAADHLIANGVTFVGDPFYESIRYIDDPETMTTHVYMNVYGRLVTVDVRKEVFCDKFTIKVEKHGRWIDNIDEYGNLSNQWKKCSSCGGLNYKTKPNYCPNCGAKMDE